MKSFSKAAIAVGIVSSSVIFALTACQKDIGSVPAPPPQQTPVAAAPSADDASLAASKQTIDITAKTRANFPIGVTKIQQINSKGAMLAVKKTAAGKGFVVVQGGTVFNPSSVTTSKRSIGFNGLRITVINFLSCSITVVEDLDDGTATVTVSCTFSA